MTIDDENSVYVGGLPYDSTEDSIRKAFDFYGRVVAVKIVNDRAVGGKCYGFVIFTNPRSVINAISDMDGKILKMEELLEEKGEVVSKLQEKSQNLEDALLMAKNLTLHHQMQLTKLYKYYMCMREYSERLKISEQELQSLVDTTMNEIEYSDDGNGVLANGNAQHQ